MPLSILLIVYSVFAIIFLVLASMSAYHMMAFSRANVFGFISTFLFLAATVAVFFTTWFLLQDIQWSDSINIAPSIQFDSIRNDRVINPQL